jgi:hypothetical protein
MRYLVYSKDLSITLLNLLQLPQKIPNQHQPNNIKSNNHKPGSQFLQKKKNQRSQPNHSPKLGLGANLVRSPEFHPINLRVLIRFSWQSPPNDLVLVKLHFQTKTPLAKAQTLILSHVSKKMIKITN